MAITALPRIFRVQNRPALQQPAWSRIARGHRLLRDLLLRTSCTRARWASVTDVFLIALSSCASATPGKRMFQFFSAAEGAEGKIEKSRHAAGRGSGRGSTECELDIFRLERAALSVLRKLARKRSDVLDKVIRDVLQNLHASQTDDALRHSRRGAQSAQGHDGRGMKHARDCNARPSHRLRFTVEVDGRVDLRRELLRQRKRRFGWDGGRQGAPTG